MAIYGWDGVPGHVAMPVAGGTINSAPFSVPRGMSHVTIHVPALAGTGATVKVQSLAPDDSATTEAWGDVVLFLPADGSFVALDGMVESTVVTVPTSLLGGGVLRFVASETQAGAPSTIKLFFHRGA